jgi:hypothetical protein
MAEALSRSDYDLASRVAQDLDYIVSTWNFDVGEDKLRRESVVLRRLLLEQEYGRAWRLIGLPKQPMVRATSLEAFLGDVNRTYVSYAFAPLAQRIEVQGGQITLRSPSPSEGDLMIAVPGYTEGVGVAMLVVPRAEVEAQGEETLANAIAQQLGGQRKWETLWLSDLLRSPSALISGTTISRADIVGYVANRLGGAHGGSKHPVKKEQKWILLDRHWALLQHLNAIYLEL